MDLLDASLGDIAERLRELLNLDRTGTSGAALSGDDLLAAAHNWEAIGQTGDAARTWVAAEIAHESRRELDTKGLAYKHGFPSAKKLLAATTNISERTAASRIHLGLKLRSSLSITGTPNLSFFPVVETAFFDGRIGVDAAAMICRTLSDVVTRTGWSDATEAAERHLVACATATVGGAEVEGGIDADATSDADADNADADTGIDDQGTIDSNASRDLPRLFTAEEIGRLAIRIRENLDPDGAEPRDAIKQQLRGFSRPRVGADGMARGRYALPPLQLGVFFTAIDSILSPRTADPADPGTSDVAHSKTRGSTGQAAFIRGEAGISGSGDSVLITSGSETPAAGSSVLGTSNSGTSGSESSVLGTAGSGTSAASADHNVSDADDDEESSDLSVIDPRTIEQKMLDAVMSLIEMAAASPAASRLNGAAPTVNVHVTLDDLETGRGVGWIDGSTEPIPISTVNQLQCDGDTVVTLFGRHGEVLNHGKTQRLATRRQRKALAARDGGCVMPGCTVPPSRCQAHHVVPWVSESFMPGRTDIDNLALLCPFHHSTIHTSAWQLEMINGKPHVRPPTWLDRQRTPRPVGQQRIGRPW